LCVVRTLLCGICLYKTVPRACFLVFWCEPGELREVFVNDADFGCEAVVVQVLCEVSSGVAWDPLVSPIQGGQKVQRDVPKPPIISTAGFSPGASSDGIFAGARAGSVVTSREGLCAWISRLLWARTCFVIPAQYFRRALLIALRARRGSCNNEQRPLSRDLGGPSHSELDRRNSNHRK
jgi:hypothetical protein